MIGKGIYDQKSHSFKKKQVKNKYFSYKDRSLTLNSCPSIMKFI